jgi:hypothetical protein
MLTALALGLVLGLRHAFDPDHVAAVSTLVARTRRAATALWLGVAWGAGHTATVFVVGGALIALRIAIPAEALAWAELPVGVMLVALGVANLRSVAHAGASPHLHGVAAGASLTLGAAAARAALVGLVHGLAGTAPLALAAVAALPGPGAAVAYLLVFGLGTLGGMAAVSLGLGLPLARLAGAARARRWAVASTGVLSVTVGLYLVANVGLAHAGL